MIRTLSAAGTFTEKYFFLALWFCVGGAIAFAMWSDKVFDPNTPPTLWAKIASLILWLGPLFVIVRLMRAYKRVRMSDEGLLISDPQCEIFVPFSAIARAVPAPIEPNAYVEVIFRAPTEFGHKIRFVPRPRYGFLPWLDPAVHEFLQRVNKA